MSVAPREQPPDGEALDVALWYAVEHGLRVIPIAVGKKHPPVPEWQRAATTDPQIIRSWWTGLYRGHGVGIATGEASGTWVLDVDVAGGKVGAESLADLEGRHGALPETVESITGTGGRHLFFAWDPEHPTRNNQSGKIAPDLDVRGEGGQVLAAPTVHPATGQPYRFRPGHGFGEIAVAAAPTWLYDLLAAPDEPAPQPATPRPVASSPSDEVTPIDWFNSNVTWESLLERDGWTRLRDVGQEQRWTRPGKNPRDGNSCSINHYGNDLMWVATSSIAELPCEATLNKFQYESRMHGGGDDRGLASHVRRTQMPSRLAGPVDDSSWTSGLPTIEAEGQTSPGDVWPDPEPLSVPLGHGMPFPLDALPAFITDFCVTKAHALQCPVDALCMAAIGALSVVTLDKVRVHVDPDDDWWEDSNLYLVSVLPSGMSKSPAFKAMLNCLRILQTDMVEEATRRIQEAEIEREIKEKKAKKLTEAASLPGADPNAVRDAITLRMELETDVAPINPRILGADVTMEKLADLFKLHGGRFALVSTEGGIFKIMAGQYSERGSAMLDVPLQAWSGDSLDQDRFSRNVGLDRVLLSMCLATQPRSIEQIGRNEEMRGSGLTARFMYSVPRTTIGRRDRRPARLRGLDRGQIDQLRKAYEDRIVAAGKRLQHPGVTALRLEMSREAHDLFTDWDQRHEDALRAGRDLAHMAEWQMKARASVVRLAALLHVAEYIEANDPSDVSRAPGEIGVATMRRALAVGDYWVDHARQVHEVWESTSGGLTYAKEIVEWAVGEWGEGKPRDGFTVTEAHKECTRLRHRNEKVATVQAAVELLDELGWVRTPSEFPGRRGASAPVVTLHPRARELWMNSAATCETSENFQSVRGESTGESSSVEEPVRQMSSETKGGFSSSLSLRKSTGPNFDVSPYPFSQAHLSHNPGESGPAPSSPQSVSIPGGEPDLEGGYASSSAAQEPQDAPPSPETPAGTSQAVADAQAATQPAPRPFGDW